jgi:AcrR family transcriptional regulator
MTTDAAHSDSDPKPGTRERLLDVAERVFAERGFAGASVREITDGAEANLGAINYYFRSKENLYAEVFAHRISHLREQILADFRPPADLAGLSLEQALHTFGHAFLAPHQDAAYCQRLHALFLRELIEAALPPGMLVREMLTPMIETLTGIVRRERPDLGNATACACAHSFFAQVTHVVKGARVTAGTDIAITPVDEQLAHVVRFTAAAVRHI